MENPYLDAEQLAYLNELNEEVREKTKPLPYAIERRGFFKFNQLFKTIWPVMSFLTVLVFVFFFSRDSSHIIDFRQADTKALVSFFAVLTVSAAVALFIEYMKVTLNKSFWKGYILNRKAKRGLLMGFILTSLVSSVLSGLGAYMTSLEASGYKEKQKKEQAISEARSRHQRLNSEYDNGISAAKENVENLQGQIKSLKDTKVKENGKYVTEYKAGRKAAGLAPTLSKESERITNLTEYKIESEKKLQEELKGIDIRYGKSEPSLWGFGSGMAGWQLAVFVFCLFIFAELANIYANSYIFTYYKKCKNQIIGDVDSISGNVVDNISEEYEEANTSRPGRSETYDTTDYKEKQLQTILAAKDRFEDREGRQATKADLARETGFSYGKIRNYIK